MKDFEREIFLFSRFECDSLGNWVVAMYYMKV